MKHIVFQELLWQPVNHYARNFNISRTFKDVSNSIQNFRFMETAVFEIVGGRPLLVRSLGTKRLVKGRVKMGYFIKYPHTQ